MIADALLQDAQAARLQRPPPRISACGVCANALALKAVGGAVDISRRAVCSANNEEVTPHGILRAVNTLKDAAANRRARPRSTPSFAPSLGSQAHQGQVQKRTAQDDIVAERNAYAQV